MTIGGVVAIGFLLVLTAFVVRGIRGRKRSGDTSEKADGIGNPGTSSVDGD
jgi:hypothetical protein